VPTSGANCSAAKEWSIILRSTTVLYFSLSSCWLDHRPHSAHRTRFAVLSKGPEACERLIWVIPYHSVRATGPQPPDELSTACVVQGWRGCRLEASKTAPRPSLLVSWLHPHCCNVAPCCQDHTQGNPTANESNGMAPGMARAATPRQDGSS
jgi:hypothetical protein